jgi:hypothetical protein
MEDWIVKVALREEGRKAAAPYIRRQKKYKKELDEYLEKILDEQLRAIGCERNWGDLD